MDGVIVMAEDNPGEDSNIHSRALGSIEIFFTRDCGLQTVLVKLRKHFVLWSIGEKVLMLVIRELYEQ